MAKTLSFSLTPDQFSARKAELAGQGVVISGDTGTLDYKGVEVQYTYDGTHALTVTVEHHPFLEPEFAIDSTITKWFQTEG